MTVVIYIYLCLQKFEVAWEPNGWKYWKTKNHMSNFFWLSIFFVEEPPLYLLQGGRKLALIIYIYIYTYVYKSSRLRENRMTENIEKQKTMCPIFLDYLSFLWKSYLCISYRVAINWLLLRAPTIFQVKKCSSSSIY